MCVELQGIQKKYDVLPASFLLLTFYFFQKIDRFLYKKSFVRSIPSNIKCRASNNSKILNARSLKQLWLLAQSVRAVKLGDVIGSNRQAHQYLLLIFQGE